MKSHGQIVACLIGVTLLIAGMAKLDLHNRPAFAATESLLPAQYLVPVASLELALAAWLFSGIQATLSRFLSLLLFMGFATAAIYAIFLKKTSCGCLGSLQVSPWIMLTYDVLAVCALAASLLIDRTGWRRVQYSAAKIDSGANRLSVVSTFETE